jgi:7,8-dihydroneopterin aldolase/epimerase/oxygenase
VSDRIHVEQLEVFARVGVTDNERSKPQRLVFNFTIWPREKFDTMNDDIARTVNYSAACAAIRDFVRAQSPKLIETLAANVAAHLLENFPVRKIDIELRKFVVPDTQYVSVALTRESSP